MLKMQQQYDEKNIRRRVYDALNVLIAMEIISKDKKEIQWRGLPKTRMNDIEELKVLLLIPNNLDLLIILPFLLISLSLCICCRQRSLD
jgi:hypothetical protein